MATTIESLYDNRKSLWLLKVFMTIESLKDNWKSLWQLKVFTTIENLYDNWTSLRQLKVFTTIENLYDNWKSLWQLKIFTTIENLYDNWNLFTTESLFATLHPAMTYGWLVIELVYRLRHSCFLCPKPLDCVGGTSIHLTKRGNVDKNSTHNPFSNILWVND